MLILYIFLHPCRHILPHALLEGIAEGGVVAVAAVLSQLLCSDRPLNGHSLSVETYEMVDTQIVDIGIVSRSPAGEILAEIAAVGTNSYGELMNGQVVLQIELRVYAILLE